VPAAAAPAGGDPARTRTWILRAWMEQGRSNDTLDALDALSKAGVAGVEMSYLYGMAFARRAEGYLADGVTDSSVQMNFDDATRFLKEAVEADPERYRDAWLPLARASWYVQDFDGARWAADRAVEERPDAPDAWVLRGRIAMAQFAEAEGTEPGSAAAEALWRDAVSSFARAVELHGAHAGELDEAGRLALAEAATQLGHAWLWRAQTAEATDAYASAIAWDPQGFDYGQALQALRALPDDAMDERPRGFAAALELARERFVARGVPDDPAAPTLDWWLGWARFDDGDYAESEAAFTDALARSPELANAWFYIGLTRTYRKDHEGALAALRTGWEIDPVDLTANIAHTGASAGGTVRAFEGLMGWCATQEPPRNLDAAFLAEMLAAAQPTEPRHWNNLGLFLRDEGESLEIAAYRKEAPEPDPAVLADLYRRSFDAYSRALELVPDDPQLINDTALMLDYHLGGEPAEVEALYRHALELVEARLATAELSEDDRARFEQTKSDIGVNLHRLLNPEAAAAEAAAAEAAAAAAKAAAEAEPKMDEPQDPAPQSDSGTPPEDGG
jgi:Tfp pilus assembly protein PilF